MNFKDVNTTGEKEKIEAIISEIDKFVEWIFQHHIDRIHKRSKVIHDGVWGTHRYEKFEVSLINTPLIQRLRQIHQTAYTYLTYPSTQHTRFEHTLGVTAQVGNLFKALKDRFANANSATKDKNGLINDGIYKALRTAAILHDVGHGPLSHTSEEIYGKYDGIQLLKKYDPFKSAKPHEILSYLILDSARFKKFLSTNKVKYSVAFDDELMKNAIVGYAKNPSDRYKIDILSGPFDADKLDYLFRDGHFSGLPLQIDLDRLWYSMDINSAEGHQRLTIDWGGVISLEQIMFSKMTLYPTVYHHHKVRACDCMFKGILEYIKNNNIIFKKTGLDVDINFKKATHFLYFTDPEVFGMHGRSQDDKNLHTLMHNLQYRRLLKRAIVISKDSVKDPGKLEDFIRFRDETVFLEEMEYYRWLAKKIWEKAGTPGLLQELWVDCPKDPNFDEAIDTWVSPLDEGLDPMPLTEFFQTGQYADQYKQKKWRSHVFCRPDDIDKITKACVIVFKDLFGIEFKPLAFHLCHVTPPQL